MSESKVTYYEQHLRVERELAAPPEKVFRAYTTPEQVEQWWGPASYTTRAEQLDARTGGAWRFVHVGQDGGEPEHAFRGVYHEVKENERIVQTFEYLGAPGHVSLETMEFEPTEQGTRLTATAVFGAPEALEAMKDTGMEEGMLETYDRLAALVEA